MQVKRVHKMKVLGLMLDGRGSTETAVTHNIGAAERAVAANFDILFNSAVTAEKRFGEYRKRITPVLLHGCGSWVWTQHMARTMGGWETGVLARIWRAKIKKDEDHMGFWRRRCVEAREAFCNGGYVAIHEGAAAHFPFLENIEKEQGSYRSGG